MNLKHRGKRAKLCYCPSTHHYGVPEPHGWFSFCSSSVGTPASDGRMVKHRHVPSVPFPTNATLFVDCSIKRYGVLRVLRHIEEAILSDLRMTKMCITARERETRPPSVLIPKWVVMYCPSRRLDGLIISCTRDGAKGSEITAAGVCGETRCRSEWETRSEVSIVEND